MHPTLVNRVIFPLHERLKGKRTHAKLAELERTQWLAPAALRTLQFERLHRHLTWAYREVPYYARLLDEQGLPPARVQSFEDFARIPLLTKDVLRERLADLQPGTPLRGVQRLSTGGSTGAPVTVLVDRERSAFTDAARLRAPHRVTIWVRDFAKSFHGFYRDCRVLSDDAALTQARLWLAEACRIALANALSVLGVHAPDEMSRLDEDD